VVFREDDGEIKYLLLQYNSTYWGFVKGLVEKGERENDTIRREIYEETGISDGEFIGNFREKISYYYRREGKIIYKEVIYKLFKTESSDVKLSFEHIGYAWLPYEEAMERLKYANSKKVLRKAHEYLKKVRNGAL